MGDDTLVLAIPEEVPKSEKPKYNYAAWIDLGAVALSVLIGLLVGRLPAEVLGPVTILAVVIMLGLAAFWKELKVEFFNRLYVWIAPLFLTAWIVYNFRH